MAVLFKKNRALQRILRNKFHGAARETEAKPAMADNAPAYTLNTDIPESYNDTYIRAIPKDPQTSFIYWQMPAEKAVTAGLPDKGNAHVGNDKIHWIQERVSVHDNRHHQHHWHDNSYQPQHHQHHQHQWHDGHHHNCHERHNWPNAHHRQHDGDHHVHHCHHDHHNARHIVGNHSHGGLHHYHADSPPVSLQSAVMLGIHVSWQSDNQHIAPLPAQSSGIFYKTDTKKSA